MRERREREREREKEVGEQGVERGIPEIGASDAIGIPFAKNTRFYRSKGTDRAKSQYIRIHMLSSVCFYLYTPALRFFCNEYFVTPILVVDRCRQESEFDSYWSPACGKHSALHSAFTLSVARLPLC